jgi:uncharacterized protein YcaQ
VPAHELSLDEARRVALAAQGFDRPRPAGTVGLRHLRDTVRRLGLLQLDYVNVLLPAHFLVPFSRLGPYELSRLNELLYHRREFTEQWAHEASVVPVETWPLLRHRMETHRVRPYGFESYLAENAAYAQHVLDEVRRRGPLTADALHDPEGGRRIPGAWHGSVPRAVLEAHFGRGLLAVAERCPNFARAYDLAERVLPPAHYGRRVSRADALRQLLGLAARAHGVGTAADLADYYRLPVREVRPALAELVSAGELRQVGVEGWREPAYLHREARLPRRIDAAALLSPFDPLVWYRPRVAKLFGFDYRIEIFVPREKRRWGYYVLPFLLGDRLVGRADLAADRGGRRLRVLSAYLEPGADVGATAAALAAELRSLASWLRLDTVAVEGKTGFARPLAAAVRAAR